ncbi:hypothetical protein HK098_002359 [Nowakowskiella sp. JEL0407]|nr:hypothetical protein HK098_002359 [Nowakowskiella sp. JEL0407]
MQTTNPDSFFQSDHDLAIKKARDLKKRLNKNAGDPFVLPSKVLAFEIVAKPKVPEQPDETFAYVAESGHVARKVNLTVCIFKIPYFFTFKFQTVGGIEQTKKVVSVFKGHTGPVTSVAILYDQQGNEEFIFTGSWDKTARKWDAKTRETTITFKGHTDFVKCLALYESFLFTGSSDSSIRQWNHKTGECLKIIKGHTRAVEDIIIHFPIVENMTDEEMQNQKPNLVSCSSDCSLRKWDIESGKQVGILEGHLTSVYAVREYDGSIWSASADNMVKRWDLETSTPDSSYDHPDFAKCLAVVMGTYLITGSRDENIRIWHISTEKCVGILEGHFGEISALHVVGDTLYSGSLDTTIRTWKIDETTIKELKTPEVLIPEVEVQVADSKVANAAGPSESLMTAEEEQELAELMDD